MAHVLQQRLLHSSRAQSNTQGAQVHRLVNAGGPRKAQRLYAHENGNGKAQVREPAGVATSLAG